MIWLEPSDYRKQKYIELRLYAPKSEKIALDFNPFKISDEPNRNPTWEEWHCYAMPLRIYKQDYKLLLDYFNKIYPTKDAFDGTDDPVFDLCFGNWIGKSDWLKIIVDIEQNLKNIDDAEKTFFINFLEWLKEALDYTSIIVVESNL